MAAPFLGTLNNLRASVIVPANPGLTVLSTHLTKDGGIKLSFEGEASTPFRGLVGIVPVEQPYMMVSIELNLLKSSGLAENYKTQLETLGSDIGDITVITDSSGLSNYIFNRAYIKSMQQLAMSTSNDAFIITLGATYTINPDLYSGL